MHFACTKIRLIFCSIADALAVEAYSEFRRSRSFSGQHTTSVPTVSLSSSAQQAVSECSALPPPTKVKKSTLFTYRERERECVPEPQQPQETPRMCLLKYLEYIATQPAVTWDILHTDDTKTSGLHQLFEKIFCVPASSAAVERVFSHSGLFLRPHRARMGDKVLCNLTFVKCNKHLTKKN